jgi:hypothetical protein
MAIFKRPLYLAPVTDEQIDDEKSRLQLKGTMDNSLVREISHYLAAKRYDDKIEINKTPPDGFPEHLKEAYENYVDTFSEFLDSTEVSKYPGGSIISQANSISDAWSLFNNPDQKDGQPGEGDSGGENSDSEGIPEDPNDSKEIQEAKKFMRGMKRLEKQNKSMKSSAGSVAEKINKGLVEFEALTGCGGYFSHEFTQGNTISSMAKLTKEQKSLIDKIGVVSKFGKLKSNKISAHFKFPKMKEYGQISQVLNPSDMLMPNFALNLINRDLIVKEFIPEEKQILFVMIDDSGSLKLIRWNGLKQYCGIDFMQYGVVRQNFILLLTFRNYRLEVQ